MDPQHQDSGPTSVLHLASLGGTGRNGAREGRRLHGTWWLLMKGMAYAVCGVRCVVCSHNVCSVQIEYCDRVVYIT